MKRLFGLVITLTVFPFMCPHNVYADALALSSINVSDLQITATNGSIVFGGPWAPQGFAQAQNSLGNLNAQSNSNPGGAAANAAVPYVVVSGSANANLNATASSGVDLSGITAPSFGNSAGQGTLWNVFEITGGSGPTSVAFSALVTGLLQLTTDAATLDAYTEAIFNLTLNSSSVLFFDSILTGGSNFNATLPFSQALSGTFTLNFNTPYMLAIQADSESKAISAPVPEPATLPMTLVGLTLVAGAARRLRRERSLR